MSAAGTEAMRAYRAKHGGKTAADRAQQKARGLAVAWVRAEHPEIWRALLDQAYDELGIEPRPVGRPQGSKP